LLLITACQIECSTGNNVVVIGRIVVNSSIVEGEGEGVIREGPSLEAIRRGLACNDMSDIFEIDLPDRSSGTSPR